ncbi:MAG: AAA family ATPase [Methanolinea sp.]|nr:AAA family ATPase [Methanolinea sp.]
MIIETLSLKNWRGYRELHSFSFDKGFNLVVGRNEAGKSTLFEALTRVMFDRYSSKAEEIRKIQPLNSSLGPEVELIFYKSGHRYKVKKRFLQQPICEFFTERNSRWDLDHEGDKADSELRNILSGTASSRTAQPENRGLAQALWYLQKEESFPKHMWAEGIKQNLSGIIEFVASHPDEEAIENEINDLYDSYFTPQSGKIKSNSELAAIQNEIVEITEMLDKLHEKASNVDTLRYELEEFFERKKVKQQHLKIAQDELFQLQRGLENASHIEEQRQRKEYEVSKAEQTYKALFEDLDLIVRRNKKIVTLNQELQEAKDISETHESNARIEKRTEDTHHQKWKNEFEPMLKEIEDELHLNHALEKISQLKKERDIILEYLSRISLADGEYQKIKEELAELIAPSRKEWAEFDDTWNSLQISEAEARASAIRVKFDLEKGGSSISVNPSPNHVDHDKEFLILTPTTFTIDKVGLIHVRGGGTSLEELNSQSQLMRKKIDAIYLRFNVDDRQSLSDLHQKRVDLERDIKQRKKILDTLINEADGKNSDELARLNREITEESLLVRSIPEVWKNISSKELHEKINRLETNKKRLIQDIKNEQQYEKDARDKRLASIQNATDARGDVVKITSQISSLESENIDLLKKYGTRTDLELQVNKNKEIHENLDADLKNIISNYEKDVEIPKKLYKEKEQMIFALQEQIRKIESDIIDRKARIEESAAQGLYSQISDSEALLEAKQRRSTRLKLEADSIKLLHDMFITLRKDQSEAIAGPVSDLVSKWLTDLTDETYCNLELNEELLPTAVQSKRFESLVPLDCLSYGTYEQIVVLLRLALGVILSRNERNLVVIDDRLVNADPLRMKRLSLILQEVATNSCQIIVSTCNDTPYLGINGRVISVPADGKIS